MNVLYSLIFSFLLALLAYVKKAMTNSALLLAFIFAFIILYYGNLNSFIILATVFISTVITKKIGSNIRKKINQDIIEKPSKKDAVQILANVGAGTFAIIIYALTKNEIFLIVYASIMAESIADTLASDIGVLSKKEPVNILTLKKSSKGLSGNISLLGLISALLGSILIGLIFIINNISFKYLIIITISGFLGSIFDSFLGASIQAKYKCPKCHKIIEKKEHCGIRTIYTKGLKFINNDIVNFCSNIFSGILSFILMYL